MNNEHFFVLSVHRFFFALPTRFHSELKFFFLIFDKSIIIIALKLKWRLAFFSYFPNHRGIEFILEHMI